ncbi:acyl-CoA N-acyltransferase [Striga asiatica]|uniref:Acyl-CoA N-acyltransferase n=1 Tax=Striga asiatica TaxID=4170 RepID=A0A5A7P3Y0_STRAF|nr:acyl-CoA N-acyltransferase [Striga asiatica]
MDSTTSMGHGPNVNNQRRIWTFEEERALIQGLKELIAHGVKADNRIRSGYTVFLEQYMQQQFPGTTIRAEPHISSKITLWKKNYVLLAPLLQNTSGVGWSETGHILEVEEPIWNYYVKGVESSASGKADQRWGQMVERIGVQHDAKEQQKQLYEALKSILMLSSFIVSLTKWIDMKACYVLRQGIVGPVGHRMRNETLHYFSVLEVKAKIKALHTYFREFLTFLKTPGVDVHAETGLVTVTPTYWAYVGRETDLEYFFRHVGFSWYEECVELWDLRDAADVRMEPDGADAADLEFGNEEDAGAAGVEHMNDGANNVHEVEDDVVVEEHYEEEYVAEPAPVEVIDIESDEAPDEMDLDTDVGSCVDSE